MTQSPLEGPLGRRGFLVGGAALGGLILAGCTSNDAEPTAAASTGTTPDAAATTESATVETGKQVTIGFSGPAADHGWIAAITANAKKQAATFPDVTLNAVESTNDLNQQIASVETLINQKVDVIAILPNDGKALTQVALKAMNAGIPVVNIDRIFDSPLAYRTFIAGDNYGMGVAAGHYIGERLKADGKTNPVIAEIPGIDSLPLTQDRSRGFRDGLKDFGFKVGPRQAAAFTVESGQQVTANLLQAAPKIDAIWNHDDDQGVGVLAAIAQAGRDEFFMVGGAGSANAMRAIKEDNTVLKATVTYSPSMAASAISLARLIAQGKGFSELVEKDVPSFITLSSATITKDNVDNYLDTGFES